MAWDAGRGYARGAQEHGTQLASFTDWNKWLENYDEEEEALSRAESKRNRKVSLQGGDSNSGRGMMRTASQVTDVGRSPLTLPPRAAPPAPRRAGRRNMVEDPVQLGASQIMLHAPTPSDQARCARLRRPACYSPNLPRLTIPDVKDDRMQLFFQQIVEHLNAMEIRTGIAPPPVSPQLQSVPPSIPITSLDFGRPLVQQQPVYDLNRGAHSPREPLAPVYGSTPSNVENMRHESTHHAGQFGELCKENGRYHGPNSVTVVKKSSLRNNDTSARKQPPRVQIVEPSPRKLQRKESVEPSTPTPTPTMAVSPVWSDSSFTLPSTTLAGECVQIQASELSAIVRARCVYDSGRMQADAGGYWSGSASRSSLTLSKGSGILECRFDETRDPTVTVMKAVRFRVEVREATAGFQVALQLVQEKGTSSSFQTICEQLRSVWELDFVRQQMGVHSPLFSPDATDRGRFTEMMVYPD